MIAKNIDSADSTQSERPYDVIIIGSGMGGLTTASLLAQFGRKRVLILESHFKPGGFTHSFRRKKYEWDAGVHYIGDMQPGSLMRGVMDLVTGKQVQWHRMGSPYESFLFEEGSFDVPEGQKEFCRRLCERFPDETDLIKRYFRDVRKAQSWVVRWFISKQFGPLVFKGMNWFGKSLVTMTTQEYLDRFRDPLLKAILAAQWPDFGSPPQESAFGFHATVTADFFNGGFFPVGGAQKIAAAVLEMVRAKGGDCLVNHRVTQVLVENDRACGVVAENKGRQRTFRAPLVISNAGGALTFSNMVSREYGEREREKISRLKPGTSANILFLGLNDDPQKHGFDSRNYWMYSRLDHDVRARFREGDADRIDGCFLSFGSLRNPGQTPHTAQIVTFCDESEWSLFGEGSWMNRSADYERHKKKVADNLLDYVEQRLPGLKSLVDYSELSTPYTVKSFTSHLRGAIYGQACDPNRLFRDQWSIATTVPGLWLTGSDVGTPGVNGAMMAGVMTAAKALGLMGLPRIMARAMSG